MFSFKACVKVMLPVWRWARSRYNSGRLLHYSHLLCIRCFCSTTFAISSLHQQFTFVHLFDTHLPCSPRLFPDRSIPTSYKVSTAGWFDNPACTALSRGHPHLQKNFMAQTKFTTKHYDPDYAWREAASAQVEALH